MRFIVVCVVAAVITYQNAYAEPVFLQHRVHDPVNLLTAVPSFSSAGSDSFEIQLAFTHVNVFSGGAVNALPDEELLIMDGEISQLELRGQLPLSSCLSAAFDTRLVRHAGGSFDEEIRAWHDFFQLPDANRDESPYDALTYFYSNTGSFNQSTDSFSAEQTRHLEPGTGLGDLWLSVQRSTHCDPVTGKARTASGARSGHVRIGVKLPLGDSARWASAGHTAVFADWHSSAHHLSQKSRITSTWGGSYAGQWSERFDALTPRRFVAYGGVVFDYRWNHRWESVLQFDFRSPTFHSELTELAHWGAQVHLGLRAHLAKHHKIEVSFSEDAAIDTGPDIGVRLAYSYTP